MKAQRKTDRPKDSSPDDRTAQLLDRFGAEVDHLRGRVQEIDALRQEVERLRQLIDAPRPTANDPRNYLVPGNTLAAFHGGWPGDEPDDARAVNKTHPL